LWRYPIGKMVNIKVAQRSARALQPAEAHDDRATAHHAAAGAVTADDAVAGRRAVVGPPAKRPQAIEIARLSASRPIKPQALETANLLDA
jgi:hypothetical protein